MDVSQNSPIVIHSDDDDDDDDDVVLIKTEKAPQNSEKKEEDDVIFISEEPSASVQKCTSGNQKIKKKLSRRLSSSSTSDDDNSCALPQIGYFRSEFSVSLVDDILRPLDLSQATVQTTGMLPSMVAHKLSLLKPVQTACSSAAFREQGENTSDKTADDLEINSVKTLQDFEISSGKSIDTFTGRSVRVDRFTPLKLPEGADPLSSQTLNTPICKIDPGKECFNLCSQDDTDLNQASSNLFVNSSTSNLACTDKTSSVKEKQEVPANFFSSGDKWDISQGKQALGTYESSTNLAQDIDISSDDRDTGFTSDLLTPLSAAPDELGKTVTSMLDQALGTSDDVNPSSSDCSVLMLPNSYESEINSQPGTSKQFSSISSSPETAKLHVPRNKTSSMESGSSLTLDFNNLSNEDISSLLKFFSDDNDLVTSDDTRTNVKVPSESDQSVKSNDKITELTKPACINQTNLCNSKVSSIPDHSSLTNVAENLLREPSPHSQNNSNCLSSSSTVKTDYRETSEKSSIPSVSSLTRRDYFKTLSAIKRRYSNICDNKKIPSLHPKCLSPSRQLAIKAVANSLSSKWRYQKCHLTQVRNKYSSHQPKIENSFKKHSNQTSQNSASENTDVKVEKSDPAQWQVVSLDLAEKTSKAGYSNLSDQSTQSKRRKIMQDSGEKPRLKMRLKFSPVGSEQNSLSAVPTQIQPSNIGLKKSIIRRHASMTGDIVKGVQSNTSLQRSVSENNTKRHKSAESDNQTLCVTCNKTMTNTKLSKCSKGHGVCATCLEAQVKAILTGDVKQKNIRCPANGCIEILSFDELKRALPSFVVDILEEKLDKEYLSYITKWMFTDEQLKSRSEFATSDTRMPPCPALSMRKYEEIYTQESRDPTEDLPTFWTPMERGAPVMVFEVVPDTEEYRALALQFHETLNFGDFDIVRIIRVQNPILWKYFALKRSEMVQENDGMDVTERQLYHGTHHSTLEAIARKGFDWRLSGKHGTVYGCGSYFAKTSRYSHGYTDRAGNGISVKSGSGPSRIIQPNLGIGSLGMGLGTSSTSYLSRIQTIFSLTQPPMLSLMPMITSQNQPPQPPPAHYHLPAPPPAHGQMSSLQVPAHNQTFNPVACKGAIIGGPAASSCGASTSNSPFVKLLSVASTSSTLPTVQGPLVARSPFIQGKFTGYSSCLNPSKMPFSEQLYNSVGLQSASQTPFTTLDSQFSSVPTCPAPIISFHAQPPFAASKSIFASPSTSVSNKLGPLPSTSMSTVSTGDVNGTSNNRNQTKHFTSSSSNGTKGQGESKQSSSSTKLRDHERGTTDLTTAFARESNSETHFMFVARVLVGRHTGGKTGLKRPPPLDENNPFGKSYDSCVDDIFYPQVFVIFDSNQAYPEYVIEYNWHKD